MQPPRDDAKSHPACRAPEEPEVLAAVPVGEIKLAKQAWILGETETKFAMLAKKGRFWGVLCVLGEFCTAWALMEPSRVSFIPPVGWGRDWDERIIAPA